MNIQCDKCGARFTLPDSLVPSERSLKIRCRSCRQVVDVAPASRSAASLPPPPPRPARAALPPLPMESLERRQPAEPPPPGELDLPTTPDAFAPLEIPASAPFAAPRTPRAPRTAAPAVDRVESSSATLQPVAGPQAAAGAASLATSRREETVRLRASDSSVLFDVRAMAARTLAEQSARNRDGTSSFALSALVRSLDLMPVMPLPMTPPPSQPAWLWGLVGGSAAVICGTAVFAALVLWQQVGHRQQPAQAARTAMALMGGSLLPGSAPTAAASRPVEAVAAAAAPAAAAGSPERAPGAAVPPPASTTVPTLALVTGPTAAPAPSEIREVREVREIRSTTTEPPAASAPPGSATAADGDARPKGVQPAAGGSGTAAAVASSEPDRRRSHRRRHGGSGGSSGGHHTKLLASRAAITPSSKSPARAARSERGPGDINLALAGAARASSKPASRKKEDAELLQLLESTRSVGRSHPARAAQPTRAVPAATPSLLGSDARPDKADVAAGLKAAQPAASACFTRFQVAGTAMVRVAIGGDGRVESAEVSGPLAHTPSGDCVARAVRGTRFKKFGGPTYSVTYPYLLH